MSAYGPALFIWRKDKKDMDEKEQKILQNLVVQYTKKLNIKDFENEVVEPIFYDYDGYEKKAISFLIYSSYIYSEMPEDIQKDQEDGDRESILRIGKEIEKDIPDTYSFCSYYVED